MIPSDPNRFPDDLQDVAELLRRNRPEATALELDGAYRQVHSRVRKGQNSMKSRLAMMAMLVTGLLMSGTGAGLAVTGLSAQDNAAESQYVVTTTPPPSTTTREVPCDVNGDGIVDAAEDANSDAPGCQPGSNDVLPTSTNGAPSCDEDGNGVISPSEAARSGCGAVEGETNAANPADESDTNPGSTPTKPSVDREQGAQPTRQVAASGGDQLPFTGFAAIPILVGGMALLAGGLVLRRRTTA